MSLRYPGGLITKSPTAPTTSAAKGVWTLEQALQYIKAGTWPLAALGDPYFQYNTMLLPGQGTNGAQNNTFLDSSTNNFTITRNGNTTQGTFTPFSQANGYWANYFDGSGDYLNAAAAQTNLYLNGVDSTIEGWFYLNAAPGGAGSSAIFVVQGNGAWDQGTQLNYWITADSTSIYAGGGGVGAYASAPVSNLPINQWFHLAVVYSSGTSATIYVNGRSVGSGSVTAIGSNSSYTTNVGGPFRTGAGAGSLSYLNGYASNVRIVKGSQVYTSNFTPSTTPLTAVSGTSLLTCQSNRFIDNSSNAFALTANGNVAVTPFQPFGAPTTAYSASTIGGSGYFDGSGDYLDAGSNAAFSFGTGAYTVECWVYPTSTANQAYVTNDTTNGSVFYYENATGFIIAPRASSGIVSGGAGKLIPNQWNHIVYCRASTSTNQTSIFANGARVANGTDSTNWTITGPCLLGGLANNTYMFSGYMGGVRIVKGTDVYGYNNTSITVPTAPLTAITNTSLLCNFTNAGIIDNAQDNNLETVGNAQISTTQYKWGTSSMYFDGTGDWLIVDGGSPNYIFGTGDFTIETWINPSTVSPSYQGIWDSRTADPSVTPHITLASGAPVWWVSGAARITGPTLSANTWYHIAVSRTGGSTKMFVNGNQVGSTYADTNNYTSRSLPTIGVNFDGLYPFTGYLQDLRITKGYARYPYNFTAPTAAFPLFWQAAATPSSDPYFENTTLLLPGNGTNGANNNTFLDSSTNAFTITRNGNTTQGTFTPFSQTGWGNYFAGSQSISAAASTDFQFAGDFTIESWIYPTTTGADNFFIQNSGSNYFAVNVNAGTGFEVFLNSSTPTFSPTDIVPPLNQWSHIALVRSGSTVKLYLNGVASTTTSTNSSTVGYNAIFYVGAFGTSSTGPFVGYASNFRAVNGTAVYTTNFTPPTSPLSAITNTKLLTCQSNRFIDNSSGAKAITLNGSPTIEAFSPFNPTAAYSTSTVGGSGYFDGTGDYLTYSPSTSNQFGTGSFTVEAWYYPLSTPTGVAAAYIYDARTASVLSTWILGCRLNGTGVGNLLGWFNGSATLEGSALTVNAWNHIVYVRNSGTNTGSLFLNGTRTATQTDTTNYSSTGATATIGSRYTNTDFLNGYLQDLRIVKGTAVYDASATSITIPTAPLTAITNTSLLTNFTNGAIIDNTAKNDLETVGNASISTTQSKFGGSSMYFDGSGDALIVPNSQNFDFGSGDFTVEVWVYPTASGAYKGIFTKRESSANYSPVQVLINSGTMALFVSTSGSSWAINTNASSSPALNTWSHIAVCRYGGTITLYLNGASVASGSVSTSSLMTNTARFVFGSESATDSGNYAGYMQDARVTKGIARYTTNFTPPTTAFLTL